MILGLRLSMATLMIGKVLKRPQPLSECVAHPVQGSRNDRHLLASLTGKTVKWGGRG